MISETREPLVQKVETKVKSSSAAALVAGLVVWALHRWVFKNGVSAENTAIIYAVVPAVLALVAGYFAPHTYRPVPPAPPPAPPVTPPSGVG